MKTVFQNNLLNLKFLSPNLLSKKRSCLLFLVPRKLFYRSFHVAVIRGVHGQSILYTLLETEILK